MNNVTQLHPTTDTETIIDLMRHGEPEGGACFRGSSDDPLTPRGWEQMHRRLTQVANSPWQRVISSPLRRCAGFANELTQSLRLPLSLEPDLREMHFGSWEGQTTEQVFHSDPESLKNFWTDPVKHPPPGGEDYAHFQQRVLTSWRSMCEQFSGEHLLVICHAGTIRAILGDVLGIDWQQGYNIDLPFAGISRIKHIQTADGYRDAQLVLC
ncbi:MAG: alpha-ribazole phosphatase family protein [Gammaproteobacteria bacterium]|nr:alpha-ribazole phosphatase family protein [Gammaproteobacteria bacterium]MDH5802188.1 alpha-ribazole phosphatase family protein [Gammaproteobacteria bacterium]